VFDSWFHSSFVWDFVLNEDYQSKTPLAKAIKERVAQIRPPQKKKKASIKGYLKSKKGNIEQEEGSSREPIPAQLFH